MLAVVFDTMQHVACATNFDFVRWRRSHARNAVDLRHSLAHRFRLAWCSRPEGTDTKSGAWAFVEGGRRTPSGAESIHFLSFNYSSLGPKYF